MPDFDGGHYFLTMLAPVRTGNMVDPVTGAVRSHRHLLRQALKMASDANLIRVELAQALLATNEPAVIEEAATMLRRSLVEDQNAVVAAVPDEEPSLRIHREGVGLVHFPGPGTLASPCLEQPSVPVELQNPCVGGRGRRMSLSHEDAAIRGYQHVVRLVEKLRFRRHPRASPGSGAVSLREKT